MDTLQQYLKNKQVLGSLLIGFGLVSAAYVASNFGQTTTPTQNLGSVYAVASAQAPERKYIEVVDSTGDGVEDWRAAFAPKTPIMIAQSDEPIPTFTPETATEIMSVRFFEQIMQAKAGFGPGQDVIAENTAAQMKQLVEDPIYDRRSITVIPTTNEAIRTYGNAMGSIILTNNVPGYEDEMTILDRALKTESPEEVQKILPLENAYRKMRDDALKTPVPDSFTKEHLDIINVYNALYLSLRDMRLVFEDPVLSLLRTRRYQDDATGLLLALRNLYFRLEPHANLFTADDPALVLVSFAPNFQ